MRRLATFACIGLALCAIVLSARAAQTQRESTAQQADSALLAAVGKGDATAAGALLDAQFEWTNAAGLSRNTAQALANISALATNLQRETGVQSYSYDQLEVFTGARPNARFMRVWARRPQGWRLFAMIETASTPGAAAPFPATIGGQALDCDNPCRTIPFNPETAAQREMLAIFKQLKVDEWRPNPDGWGRYVLEDVYYVTSAAVMSKGDRVARLAQQRQSGAVALPGDPVVSMRIVEFGQSAVMLARHAPYRGGKPYYSLRVWAYRDGRWQLANTQQTVIEAAAPSAPATPRP